MPHVTVTGRNILWPDETVSFNCYTNTSASGIESSREVESEALATKYIKICHININSVTAHDKLDELADFTDVNKIDIVMLTETKLDTNVHPSLYKLDHFQNPYTKHRNRQGGGVAVYIRNTISSRRMCSLEMEDEESIWIQIKVKTRIILACCIYFPPNLNSERIDDFLSKLNESVTIAKALNPSAILILGDFNTGNIYLNPNYQYRHSGITTYDVRLKDNLNSLNLEQLIDEPTRLTDTVANLRYLIFTDNKT